MRSRRRKPLPVVLLGVFLSVVLVGCGVGGGSGIPSPAQSGDGMEAQQARTEYLDLLGQIENMAPSADWKRDERPVGDQCRFPNQTTGTQFGDGSLGGPLSPELVEPLHQRAKELFESQGFRVEQSTDPGTANRRTVGFGPDKLTVGFSTGSGGSSIGGTSRCSVDPEGKYR